MSKPTKPTRKASGLLGRLNAFAKDRRGVAAIEFAFAAPLLIALYFMTMEVSQAIEANKKTGRIASMVGDLVAQQPSIMKNEIDAIMKIGGSVIQPYNRTAPRIYVTAIQISTDDVPEARVVWSRKLVDNVGSDYLPEDSDINVPPELNVAGSFLIRAEAALEYKPVLIWDADSKKTMGLASAFDDISMDERYYLRPRMSQTIPCGDC